MPVVIDTDFYQVLKVSRSASKDEIEKAAKKLLIIHHPDKHGGAQNQEAHSYFCAHVTQARNALLNRTTRIALNRAIKDGEILVSHEPPPVIPRPKFTYNPSKPAQEEIPLPGTPPKTPESRPRFRFTIPTTSSRDIRENLSPFSPSPESGTTSNSSYPTFSPQHARENFRNTGPSNSQQHSNPQQSTDAQGHNKENGKDDNAEDSDVLEPGQDSDNEGNWAPNLERSGIEDGIPFAEWLKDPVGSRRLIYGSFSSNLVCLRRLGKFDIKGKEVSLPGDFKKGRIPYKECRLLRGWERLSSFENERKIFEKLKKKNQISFTTFEDLLEKRRLPNRRTASRPKGTEHAKRHFHGDDSDDADEEWSGAKKQKWS